jgi:hypothetical protein
MGEVLTKVAITVSGYSAARGGFRSQSCWHQFNMRQTKPSRFSN